MADFLQFCNQFSPLEKVVLDELAKCAKTKTVNKGDYLLQEGDVCRNLFFINEGLAKAYFFNGDKEFIMRFFSEGVLFTIFESYITQMPSTYRLVALEPTTVTLISHDKMSLLCQQHHCMETFFRKLVSIATLKMTKRITELLEENSTNRYKQFVNDNNNIVQRISLGDLAKYLGITQQSLSRIRASK